MRTVVYGSFNVAHLSAFAYEGKTLLEIPWTKCNVSSFTTASVISIVGNKPQHEYLEEHTPTVLYSYYWLAESSFFMCKKWCFTLSWMPVKPIINIHRNSWIRIIMWSDHPGDGYEDRLYRPTQLLGLENLLLSVGFSEVSFAHG
jgi:hypothetical protein